MMFAFEQIIDIFVSLMLIHDKELLTNLTIGFWTCLK